MAEASRLHNKYTNAGSTTPHTDKSTFQTGSPTAPLPCVKAILVSSDSSMSKVESSVFRAIPIFISSAAALFSPDTSGALSSPIASTSLTMASKGFLAAAGTFPSASSSLSLRPNDIKVILTYTPVIQAVSLMFTCHLLGAEQLLLLSFSGYLQELRRPTLLAGS